MIGKAIGSENAAERLYTPAFFAEQKAGVRRSAKVIVPIVLEMFAPKSVVDVGCGTGTWLATFREHGIVDVVGVDGDYVDPRMLDIPGAQFLPFDLTKPLRLERRFDLVMSLEVAEHLPWSCADGFVESLTRLGSAVLFSAAIPYQGGTSHVNEQWPEFWASRFAQRGYVAVDLLRRRIWNRPDVQWWYAQNMLVYVEAEYCSVHPRLRAEADRTDPSALSLVHPVGYLKSVSWERRVQLAIEDVDRVVPAGQRFVWIDQGELADVMVHRVDAITFPQHEGRYAGPPPDGRAALFELERMRQQGVAHAVVAWPAFWWLDYYSELGAFLRNRCRRMLENDRLLVCELQPSPWTGSIESG